MRLVYDTSTFEGFVIKDDGTQGSFTGDLGLSLNSCCDKVWYDSTTGQSFACRGAGRRALTDDEVAEIAAAIPTISI